MELEYLLTNSLVRGMLWERSSNEENTIKEVTYFTRTTTYLPDLSLT